MIDFYYWGTQCPYNFSNIEVLKTIEEKYDVEVNYYDLDNNHNLASQMKLYSPTMTVFDNELRWSGPITLELIERYLKGESISRTPYIVKSKNIKVEGELKLLTPELSQDTRSLCCSRGCNNSAFAKGTWMKDVMTSFEASFLGVLHYVNDVCVGGVEYVPSLVVPYDVPKDNQTAFLTCAFISDPIYDYKSHPLERLEVELKKEGYTKLCAVVSREVAFPNGPLNWFTDNGFIDKGLLYYEKNDHAYQHLVEKIL